MSQASAAPELPSALKWLTLALVGVSPLAFGAGSPNLWLPLFTLTTAISAASWWRAHRERASGHPAPEVPGRRLLLAVLALGLFQSVPLPPAVLAVLSPGTWSFHYLGQNRSTWHAISVSPGATARGLLCLGGAIGLYALAFREFGGLLWRRRALATLATAGAALGAVGLIQAASDHPRRLYGLIDVHIERGWAVWGPYMNHNHLAGYIAATIPLGIGLAIAGTAEFRRQRRRFGFGRALGDPSFPAAVQWSAFALFLVVATLAPQSRGALLGVGAGLAMLLVLSGHARVTLAAGAALALVVLSLMDFSAVLGGFEARGFNRLGIWRATVPMVAEFPVFGAGLNTFLIAFQPYQVDFKGVLVTAAHNDYLQVLTDLGLVGVALASALAVALVRAMWRARGDILVASAAAGVAAAAAHALVDYSLQTPANAAAFAVLCGVVMAGPDSALNAPGPAPTIASPLNLHHPQQRPSLPR